MSPGSKCLERVERARKLMAEAVGEIEQATHAIRTHDLAEGIDPRALAVARTNLETAELWATRAIQ